MLLIVLLHYINSSDKDTFFENIRIHARLNTFDRLNNKSQLIK